jgi:hypothetical protein
MKNIEEFLSIFTSMQPTTFNALCWVVYLFIVLVVGWSMYLDLRNWWLYKKQYFASEDDIQARAKQLAKEYRRKKH